MLAYGVCTVKVNKAVEQQHPPLECRASALASKSWRSEPPLTMFSFPAADKKDLVSVVRSPLWAGKTTSSGEAEALVW
jgi:hypothetical protein